MTIKCTLKSATNLKMWPNHFIFYQYNGLCDFVILKTTTIGYTFEYTTNSCTVDVQAY